MTDQPTILVKKSDGTTERITLAELRKRQQGIVETPVSNTVSLSTPLISSAVPSDNTKAMTAVAASPASKPVVLKTEDVKPLLHEELEKKNGAPTAPVNRGDQVGRIIESLSFKVSDNLANRLRSCIQLRLKDIRSESDTLDMCVRAANDGGLGLTIEQAKEILAKSKPSPYIAPLSQVKQETVVEDIKKQQAVDTIISANKRMPDIAEMVKESSARTAQSSLSKPIASKTFHDVKSKPVALGPIDEIEYFSLQDLRRLALSVPESIERFKQKFLNLRAESFSLFMDSWSAWRRSPLYMEYIEAIDVSLSEKKHLSAILGGKEKISMLEVEGIIKMEQELDL